MIGIAALDMYKSTKWDLFNPMLNETPLMFDVVIELFLFVDHLLAGGAADRAAIQTPSLLVFAPPARPTAKVQEVNNSRGQEVNKVGV